MTPPNRAKPSATSTDRKLSEFLLRACHDLRGPLRAIRTHTELLLKRGSAQQASEVEQNLVFIVTGAAQASLLVDSLTDYSLALQTDPTSFQPVPIEVILRAALAKIARRLRENGADVTYESLPCVQGNPDRLMQLFEYLLDNAVCRRGPDEPRVRITAESMRGAWLFKVWDNGPALEAALLEDIFRPFVRLHGKEHPALALAICREIVERHGGTIWAESEPGGGCVFCFTLPSE